MEYQLERSGREISKRSALENPSKRSDAALNIDMQDGETDDEYNQVLDEQPDLDKVFESCLAAAAVSKEHCATRRRRGCIAVCPGLRLKTCSIVGKCVVVVQFVAARP